MPAFRAVAEREHVQQAAREMHVTASSLSRAVGLVEQSLGKKLFDRVGRNLRLNHDGAALLAALRDGMRLIDDGVAAVLATELAGELHVGCEGDQPLDLLWRAIRRLQEDAPLLAASVHRLSQDDVAARLLRGELDVAVVSDLATRAERLRVEQIATVTYGIYCGKGHPLFTTRTPSLEDLLRHPFLAPTDDAKSGVGDRWPVTLTRVVTLRVPSLGAAIAACASGSLLAVLPDVAVRSASEPKRLRRLPSTLLEPSSLYAISRHSLGGRDRAAALVAALRTEAARAGLEPAHARPSLRRKSDGGGR